MHNILRFCTDHSYVGHLRLRNDEVIELLHINVKVNVFDRIFSQIIDNFLASCLLFTLIKSVKNFFDWHDVLNILRTLLWFLFSSLGMILDDHYVV